jgi:hypothetical protein
MMYSDDYDVPWVAAEDELVQRLRSLEWPKPEADLKERCWAAFQRDVADRPVERRPVDASRPFEYSLPAVSRGHVPSERMAAARGLSLRRHQVLVAV